MPFFAGLLWQVSRWSKELDGRSAGPFQSKRVFFFLSSFISGKRRMVVWPQLLGSSGGWCSACSDYGRVGKKVAQVSPHSHNFLGAKKGRGDPILGCFGMLLPLGFCFCCCLGNGWKNTRRVHFVLKRNTGHLQGDGIIFFTSCGVGKKKYQPGV